jgi:ATP-dependent Lon protease
MPPRDSKKKSGIRAFPAISLGAQPPVREVAILPVRHTVLFPYAFLPFNIGRPRSITLLNDVMAGDRTICV